MAEAEPEAAPAAADPVAQVRDRDKAEGLRSRELVFQLALFAAAYIFIIWASLYSPMYLLLALLAVPFLPYRWWGIVLLFVSALVIFSLCNWRDVHTAVVLYRDAHEGHWI